jgi:hypothetical protein
MPTELMRVPLAEDNRRAMCYLWIPKSRPPTPQFRTIQVCPKDLLAALRRRRLLR